MTQSKEVRWVKLGDFIHQLDERNHNNELGEQDVRGISVDKVFTPTKANLDGVSLSSYKVVPRKAFAYVPDTSRRGDKIALAFNDSNKRLLISSIYTTFYVFNEDYLPEYLYMWFSRQDFNRFARFHSWGSARETLSWQIFCDIEIPVPFKDGEPDVERQKEVVDIWQGLRRLKEENEAIAKPLLDLCDAKMDELKHSAPMVALGDFIELHDSRNSENILGVENVRGLATSKEIIPTKANMTGVSLSSYKIFKPFEIAYVSDTSRRGDKVSLAHNQSEDNFLLSSISTVFASSNFDELDPTYIYLWFCRSEFDRYARFNSWGSARETFSWDEMCRVKIPKPSIEIQRAIVDIYHCARRAKAIAEEANQQLKSICPALMQYIIHSAV